MNKMPVEKPAACSWLHHKHDVEYPGNWHEWQKDENSQCSTVYNIFKEIAKTFTQEYTTFDEGNLRPV